MIIGSRRWRASKGRPPPQTVVTNAPEPPVSADLDADAVQDWIAFWDADRRHVAATGEHLRSVMWSDDRAVGLRGWYY
jgi:hypothetical protein